MPARPKPAYVAAVFFGHDEWGHCVPIRSENTRHPLEHPALRRAVWLSRQKPTGRFATSAGQENDEAVGSIPTSSTKFSITYSVLTNPICPKPVQNFERMAAGICLNDLRSIAAVLLGARGVFSAGQEHFIPTTVQTGGLDQKVRKHAHFEKVIFEIHASEFAFLAALIAS
jgi:hypothetical protein